MDTQGFLFLTAAVFLLVAVVGGGISVKEFVVPAIPVAARVALAVLGLGAVVLALSTGPAGSSPPPCRHPVAVPQVADGSRTEDDARRLLTEAGLFNVVSAPRFDPNAPHGVVVGMTPAPGSILCPRELVTITVTR